MQPTPTPPDGGWWFQQPPSAEWQWIALAVGLVAFVLAVLAMPSIAQMIWGRGTLRTEYRTEANGKDRSLIVFLSNPPVRRKALRSIGVYRIAVQSLEAAFQIKEAGSGTIVDTIRHAQFKSTDHQRDDLLSERIVLPPTYSVGAAFTVAIWDNDAQRAVVVPDRLRSPLLLEAGLYRISINYLIDGEPREEERIFKVGRTADELMWVHR